MAKVIVTGGSGFIGSNLVNKLLELGWVVLNYDINAPKIEAHYKFWKNIDVTDRRILIDSVRSDNPDYIIHLAARTDLNEKYSLDGYAANIEGVRNNDVIKFLGNHEIFNGLLKKFRLGQTISRRR